MATDEVPAPAASSSDSPPASSRGPTPNIDPILESPPATDDSPSLPERVKTLLIGKPRDLRDDTVFHSVSLVAFLAWVGLGADGLSSSCYGPAEAFHNLGGHTHLAIFLALATVFTVFVISACYSHIIEEFPSGGGGYLVASKLLGRPAGVVSGCALLVDYVLTITVSIAAAGDAMFGLLNPYVTRGIVFLQGFAWLSWLPLPTPQWKLYGELLAIVVLIVMNLRGIKESVVALVPVFLLFLFTHALLIGGSILLNVGQAGSVASNITRDVQADINNINFGMFAMLALLLHAYSLGAGTYTGIEAVSNSMPVMREPRVATAQRTMRYMAFSLAFTAGGLMLAYLLLDIHPAADKTMNQVLAETFKEDIGLGTGWLGGVLLWATMLSEGALLFVAAQAGFIDGPRVLSNMAHDSYVPHWFGSLSERLASQNGILLMGLAAIAALVFTQGNVSILLVMYSINVFVTFSLSMVGMCRHWWNLRSENPLWRRRLSLFVAGATMCLAILTVTIWEKFHEGGYVTLGVTGLCVALCFLTNRYYRSVLVRLRRLDRSLTDIATSGPPNTAEPDPNLPTAVVLVGGYNGLGVHTLLNALRFGNGKYQNVVFVSAAIVDSGNFKGAGAIADLEKHAEASLAQYVDLANRLGLPATSFLAIGTEAVDELENLCMTVAKRFPRAAFFAGNLVFQRDTWYQRLLHNQTAYALQRRLQWDGIPVVIMPTRVH